jgi:hypothetical protein
MTKPNARNTTSYIRKIPKHQSNKQTTAHGYIIITFSKGAVQKHQLEWKLGEIFFYLLLLPNSCSRVSIDRQLN